MSVYCACSVSHLLIFITDPIQGVITVGGVGEAMSSASEASRAMSSLEAAHESSGESSIPGVLFNIQSHNVTNLLRLWNTLKDKAAVRASCFFCFFFVFFVQRV